MPKSRAQRALELVEIAMNGLKLCVGAESVGSNRTDLEDHIAITLRNAAAELEDKRLAHPETV